MGESRRQSWVRTTVFPGIGYALVGIAFAVPATHVRAWRLAAWVVSAIGYAAHLPRRGRCLVGVATLSAAADCGHDVVVGRMADDAGVRVRRRGAQGDQKREWSTVRG